MGLNACNTWFNGVQTFGLRTAKLHLNRAAVDKAWPVPTREKSCSFLCHCSGLVSGVLRGIKGYMVIWIVY